MRTVKVSLPDQVELNEYDLKMAMAVKLYETGKLSIGQAAALAGFSKKTFIEIIGNFGGSIFSGYSVQDLINDIGNA
jgi:predicted HTH domain antitoxin